MNKELFEALRTLEKEKGLPIDFMTEKIEKSIVTACKSNYGNEDVVINLDVENDIFKVFLRKLIVEEVKDPNKQISLEDASKEDPNATLGGFYSVELDPKEFGRISAQTARNIIKQGIKDGEREQIFKDFQTRNKEIASGIVEKIDKISGTVVLKIGKAETALIKKEQIGNEKFEVGEHIKVYVVDVVETDKGPRVLISRTHTAFVKKLFESEIPEIIDGIIEIKAISREPGSRTKIAVKSQDPQVDAVGSCIGPHGSRVNAISNELNGERIDVVEFDPDPVKFITNALAPARVSKVVIEPGSHPICHVTVANENLSLAIGGKGQNVRLAAKLTGFKIDILPEFPEKDIAKSMLK
jgi:N utilization substance protein A